MGISARMVCMSYRLGVCGTDCFLHLDAHQQECADSVQVVDADGAVAVEIIIADASADADVSDLQVVAVH